MPRIRSSSLETPTARLRFAPKWVPYSGPTLARGIKLLYRRNKNGAGTWVVRVANNLTSSSSEEKPKSPYWTRAFGLADDYDKADGVDVLNYWQAHDRAKKIARGGGDGGGGGGGGGGKPITVAQALDDYERDLTSRGGNRANTQAVRYHMNTALAAKPVALLTSKDLRAWRDGLAAKMKLHGNTALSPASVNRIRVGLRAALEFAAAQDPRIRNRDQFKHGLQGLPDATNARCIVLPDADVLRIVAEAYRINQPFGLLVEVLAQTGARMSQVVRITCGDLSSGRRLLMPASHKGKVTAKKRPPVSVPITLKLAAALEAQRAGRADDDPLLLTPAGERWPATTDWNARIPFRTAVTCAGLDPDKITPYALRHSSICRSVLAMVPVQIVARLHDTSVKQIESHYGKHIDRLQLTDDIARRGLLQSPADNVVSMPISRREVA